MTLTDLVLDLDHSRKLQSVLAAKGIKMEAAFSWAQGKFNGTIGSDLPKIEKSDFIKAIVELQETKKSPLPPTWTFIAPAPTLEELLAFLGHARIYYVNNGDDCFVEQQGKTWRENGHMEQVSNPDPKLAACELIERMVSQ